MISGLVHDDHKADIQACVEKASDVNDEIADAIEKLKTEDLSNIAEGLSELYRALEKLPTELDTCSAIQGDLTRIEAWGQIINDPQQLIQVVSQNLIAHHLQIMNDLSVLRTDVSEGKFGDAGETAADLMIQTIGEVPGPTADHVNMKFITGVW